MYLQTVFAVNSARKNTNLGEIRYFGILKNNY